MPEESAAEEHAIDAIVVCNELSSDVQPLKRPTTLQLNCISKSKDNKLNESGNSGGGVGDNKSEKQKFLYRSNSSRMYKRPKPKLNLDYEFDKIYFISSNKDDEFYDSIDVIDERRNKNFKRSGSTGLCRSSTVIYSEYCSTTEYDTNNINSKVVDTKRLEIDKKSNGHDDDDIESVGLCHQPNTNNEQNEEISRKSSSIECLLNSENGINDKNVNKKNHVSETDVIEQEQTTITVQAEIEEHIE